MRALPLDDLAERRGPDVAHRLAQRFVFGDDHAVGAAACDLGRGIADVLAEDERDARTAELPCELPAFGDELEGRS